MCNFITEFGVIGFERDNLFESFVVVSVIFDRLSGLISRIIREIKIFAAKTFFEVEWFRARQIWERF